MASYSVAEAKNTLPRLIDKAMAGEEVVITRHGKVVAELRSRAAVAEPRAPYDYAALGRRRRARGTVSIDSVELINAMYEEDRD
ncbi:MAG: type II toxin-antitoxin system prevent-host-death family antitoxin [Sphingomonadaceae bacterium]|nr:type II toxin-antitoxin system prevent-host-death family antitoxin [Sphingomonadaceae bacterium]